MSDAADTYESLLRFLYRAPVALVQARLDGSVEIMTPLAAQLLMPLSRNGRLDNLFEVLETVAPELHGQTTAFAHATGTVCDAMRLAITAGGSGAESQVLSLSLLKLDDVRLMAMLSDITAETQRAEQEREATGHRLAAMSSDLDHALAVAEVSMEREDLSTGRIFPNQRLRDWLGLPEAPKGHAIEDVLRLVHPDDRIKFSKDRALARAGTQTSFRDFRFLRPDGTIGFMAGRRFLERDTRGQPTSLVTFGIDVTEQRSAERERLALAEHLRLATTSAGVGTFEVDARSDTVAWNAQTYALFGHPDQIGKDPGPILATALAPTERLRVLAWQRGLLQGQPGGSIEFQVTWPNAEVHWLAGKGQARRDHAGRIVSLIGVMWDTTEHRRVKAAAQAQQVAEQANRAKTEFLTRLSHELRTPLNAILGFSEILLLDQDHSLSERQHGQLDHIRVAGQHLLRLITDLLDVSRIELGSPSVRIEDVDVMAAVRSALHEVEAMAQAGRVRLAFEPSGAEQARVWADPTRLKQVLLNLLSNAIKYNREGGRVELRLARRDDRWKIVVADTGVGLSDAQRQQLFQPFNRLGREASGIQGVGIGLAIARQLVEAMGGELTLVSEVQVGSEFTVLLRASDDVEPESDPTDARRTKTS